MPSRKQHSGAPVRHTKVSRSQASEAREELASGGLSHQERRRLRSVIRTRDENESRRRLEFRHVTIVVAGALLAVVVVGATVGLVSAVQAAGGRGTAGTFVVGFRSCVRRGGCIWVGTFRPKDGGTVPDVSYGGTLPVDAGPGMSFPAIDPGGSYYVYPPHGSTTWVYDLLLMAIVGGAVGFLLWISPVGLGRRNTSEAGVV